MSSDVEISSITVKYDKTVAVSDFSLNVPSGQMVVLLGASGCGKTTVLNSVAGFLKPADGEIRLGRKVLSAPGRGINLPPEERGLGMVFQTYALWPHKTVAKNISYPLERARAGRQEIDARVDAILRDIRCESLAARYPAEISGGQQQRVALARALIGRPGCVLFDEPLSNLDAALRRDLREQIKELQRSVGFTGLYVTHDQEEALALGDLIAVMRGGRIEQIGAPASMYRAPATAYVARFLGANCIRGTLAGDAGRPAVDTDFGMLDVAASVAGASAVSLAVHPEDLAIVADDAGAAVVVASSFIGKRREYRLRPAAAPRHGDGGDETILVFGEDRADNIETGRRVAVSAKPGRTHVIRE